MAELWLPSLAGLIGTALFAFGLKRPAVRLGLVDEPDLRRKHHHGSVPLVGGLAIALGLTLSASLAGFPLLDSCALVAGALLVVLVGVLDDLCELNVTTRFVAQIAAGILLTLAGDLVLDDLGAIGSTNRVFQLGVLAIPFTVFACVGIINAMNMSDGVDGLAGALTATALIGLLAVATLGDAHEDFTFIALAFSCLLGFLVFNLRWPGQKAATVFLGDAGSGLLGFLLAWFVVKFAQGEDRIMTPVTALWFLMMPLFDTAGVTLRRLMRGHSPFAADREHFHHVFMLAGFSPAQTTLSITALALTGTTIGLLGLYWHVPEGLMLLAFFGLFGAYFFGMTRAWRVMRFLRRSICRRQSPAMRRVAGRRRVSIRRQTNEANHWSTDRRMNHDRRTGMDQRRTADRRGASDDTENLSRSAATLSARPFGRFARQHRERKLPRAVEREPYH